MPSILSVPQPGENNSKFFRELSLQTSATIKFLIPLNAKSKVDDKKLIVVAEALEKINPPLEKGKKRTKNDEDVDGNFEKKSHRKKIKHQITHTFADIEFSSDE
ncbi:RING/U-box superfamily protein [Striga asiatica]|uniref:RING/U-box superfamily protein n=1 Tax=Striga asiatica TaxID=4170 RepID=A0A5A7PN16_STRAF|nr:RING/U-box superfamily protein [Striga asiatica]